MRSAERLTRPKALAALRPAGPPPTTMTSYVGNGLSGIVRIGEVIARRNKRPVTRVNLAKPIAVSSVLFPVFPRDLSLRQQDFIKRDSVRRLRVFGIHFPCIRAAKVHMNHSRERISWHAPAVAF